MAVSTKRKNSLKSKSNSKTRKQFKKFRKSRKNVRKMKGGNVDVLSNLFFNNIELTSKKDGWVAANDVWKPYIEWQEMHMGGRYIFKDLFKENINSSNSRGQKLLYVMCRFSNSIIINEILNNTDLNLDLNSKSYPDDSNPAIGCAYSEKLTVDEKIKILKLMKTKGARIEDKNKKGEDIYEFLIASIKRELRF